MKINAINMELILKIKRCKTDKEYKYPIKIADKDKTVLLLDTGFATNDYLDYALKHNVDILYTQTTSTNSIEVMYEFIKNGFQATLKAVPRCIDGIQLNDEIQVIFTRQFMKNKEKQIEIIEKAVRKDKEVGMADLLNQEIAELQKEKQIEEMARVLCQNHCTSCTGATCLALLNCKALYNHGYRKIKENEVVISKDEYKLFQSIINNLRVYDSERDISKTRKETAKEILTLVGNMSYDCDSRFKLKDYQWHKNLCRKYGVEIGETK